MKIAYKITACQLILLAFILANGLYAVYSSVAIRSSLGTIRTEVLAQEEQLGELRFLVSEIVGHTKSFFLSSASEDKQALESKYKEFEQRRGEFLRGIGVQKEAQAPLERLGQEAGDLLKQVAEVEALLANVPDPIMQRTLLAQKLTALGEIETQMETEFLALKKVIGSVSTAKMNDIDAAAAGQRTIAAVIAAISAVAAIVLSWLLTRSIAPPMRQAVSMMQSLERGDVGRRLNLRRNDEIGEMGRAMDAFAESLQEDVVASMQKLAAGDLNLNVTPRGESDLLRKAIRQVGIELEEVLSETRAVAEQLASGSGQVAESSQSLSQGATEQASSLEEIAASMHELASQTKFTAGNAAQANQLSTGARQSAEEGNRQMQEMVAAMGEINDSGKNISRIIKTIDEIAFQTNLLALNAAVEAARAGQHGKGFAVVAEEVRNLAARSAKAARETAELIEGSVAKTENGARIARQTAGALQEIVSSITMASDLVGEISAASTEQAEGISQINIGLSQIDQVTQQNTANAEESAAAAEELSAQAKHLTAMLQRFRLREVGAVRALPGAGDEGVLIRWSEELSVGIASIDRQHQTLVDLVNQMFTALKGGRGQDALEEVFDRLIDYTQKHFWEEERMMAAQDYPGLEEQKNAHAKLVSQVQELRRKFRDGGLSVASEVFNFLKGWLVHHIQGMDKKYTHHMNERGVR